MVGTTGELGEDASTTSGMVATSGASSSSESTGGSGPGPGTSIGTDGSSDGGPGDSSTGSDTTGAPASCLEDAAACTAWILPIGASEWEALEIDAASPLAPASTIRAAFAIEATSEGFVLTDTQVHVVDLATRQWTRVELRNDLFPEAVGDLLLAAQAVPASHAGDPNVASVTLLSEAAAYVYSLDVTTGVWTFDQAITDYAAEWNASGPELNEIRASWIDVTNPALWFDADILSLCGVAADPGPYAAYTTADAVHLSDAGYCFEFVLPEVYADFLPMTYANAPAAPRIGAALYGDTAGLWVFAEGP